VIWEPAGEFTKVRGPGLPRVPGAALAPARVTAQSFRDPDLWIALTAIERHEVAQVIRVFHLCQP
jgi:hypothetical protein